MNTKLCNQCGESFEPRRTTQRYCSTKCSHRHRDREWRNRHQSKAAQSLRAQLTVAATENRINREAAATKFQRQLAEARQTARDQLEREVNRHDQELGKLHARLRDLATVNVDLCSEIPELKAQVTELQLDNARLLHGQHADSEELMQIAGRLFQLSSRLGIPLDKATKEIFQRRGWRTNTLVTEP
ncbi:hypothetical protein [Paenarthrobacter sp. PH39-S1]|uniref:hypothetical protein n=1 Tax=Paenarthrobacter sp. PH39-S1 TaxID=3046204 RepID=UPI0024B91055|nr:hypothetical protein [Paenarthrobacter sp. PH39-S1]MDJ0356327.1 hypothetical protein [Paenarthrobacter sp. PH39-S1]